MTQKPVPRIKVEKEAAKGAILKIKTLISHVMETGNRLDAAGNLVPRKIMKNFKCEYNGKLVFQCDLEPGMSANPYFEFYVRAEASGALKFTWIDDDGAVITATEPLSVS